MSKKVNISCTGQIGGTGQLAISGNLTIRNVAAVKEALQEAMEKYISLNVSVSDVSSLDLSVVQVIYSAKKASIPTQWDITLPEDSKTLLTRAGLDDI